MDIVNVLRGNENIESENVVRISGSEGSLEDSFMDGGPSFMDGTVGTYSNHGIEITGDEEVRGRTRSSTWKSARSGCYCFQVQKINQDRGSIEYPLLDNDQALFCVFDGHGPGTKRTAPLISHGG